MGLHTWTQYICKLNAINEATTTKTATTKSHITNMRTHASADKRLPSLNPCANNKAQKSSAVLPSPTGGHLPLTVLGLGKNANWLVGLAGGLLLVGGCGRTVERGVNRRVWRVNKFCHCHLA